METEYPLLFLTAPESPSPPPESLYLALEQAIEQRLRTVPAGDGGRFMANGGAFNLERDSSEEEGGLLEMATPECAGPAQLLVYQQAQERLLEEVLPQAQKRLEQLGFQGRLALLKNCRDPRGQVYGVQENYEACIATGFRLWLLRLLTLPTAVVALAASLVVRGLRVGDWLLARVARKRSPYAMGSPARWSLWELRMLAPLGGLFQALAFRDVRDQGLAFLASRVVVIGAGTLNPDGSYHLSERASTLNALTPSYRLRDRPMFRLSNLVRHALEVVSTSWRADSLLSPRRRLQLGCSEANLCPKAEYLKLACCCLVLDMIEADFLVEAPRLQDPVEALKAFSADPTLQARVPLEGGGEACALDLQRWYLNRAKQFVREQECVRLEARRVVELWESTLDLLENDPGKLFGTLDWVTKRMLIGEASDEPLAMRKKLDVRYHELGDRGYLRTLQAAGLVESPTAPEQVRRAVEFPPEGTPALARVEAMNRFSHVVGAVFRWDHVRVGDYWNRKVIPFVRPEPHPHS